MTVSVVLNNIVQEYPDPSGQTHVRIVDDVSLSYDKPGINMLLGPSGCGKSTIMKMMGGVRPYGTKTPTSGTVTIDGVPCDTDHPDVIMVFQQYANRPDLTVRQNVAYPFTLKLWKDKLTQKEQDERIDVMLETVGLADRAHNRPSQLSGGQNQRLALAQALVLRPRILLMDEPFGALDAQTRVEMQHLLIKLWEEQQCLIVFVTHDITEAMMLGDRVTVFSKGPAKIAYDITIAEARPRTDTWLRSTEAVKMEERIINVLRESAHGGGQLRVSV